MGSSFSLDKSMKPIKRPNAHSNHTPFQVAPGTVNTGNVQMPCRCDDGASYQQPFQAQVFQPPHYMTHTVAGNGYPVAIQQTHGYGMQHPGYGMQQPVYVMQQPGYGMPIQSMQQPSYGMQHPMQAMQQAVYGKQQPVYGMHQPGPTPNLGYPGASTMESPPPYTENSEPMVGSTQNEANVTAAPVTEVSPNVETAEEETSSILSHAHKTDPVVNENTEKSQITEAGSGATSNQEELLLV